MALTLAQYYTYPLHTALRAYNAANNGRLVIVNFVQKWRSHAQKAQAQGCPESAANDVAWPCYVVALL